MKAKLTHIEPKYKRDQKYLGRTKRTIVYLINYAKKDSGEEKKLEKYSPDRILDQWFSDWKIHELSKKSEAWSKAKRIGNKYIYKAIKSLVPCKSVLYSRNAGCTCGCSPGYIVNTPEDTELVGTTVDMEVYLTPEERTEFLNKLDNLTPIVALEWAEERQLGTLV